LWKESRKEIRRGGERDDRGGQERFPRMKTMTTSPIVKTEVEGGAGGEEVLHSREKTVSP